MNPWKACDIRGPFPEDVSPELFRLIGHSVASAMPAGAKSLVAGDFRTSTPILKSALIEGLVGSGSRVLDAGQIPTPVAYFAHQHFETDAVLIVTASHNPPAHNGLKLMVGGLPPVPDDFAQLRSQVGKGVFRSSKGSSEELDPVPAYRQWIIERWKNLTPDGRLAVVLDAGNGAWSELAPRIFDELGIRFHRLYCDPDGTYPNRSPDCGRPGALEALKSEVTKTHSQLGIAWDGRAHSSPATKSRRCSSGSCSQTKPALELSSTSSSPAWSAKRFSSAVGRPSWNGAATPSSSAG
jgi:phosphomannomutase